MLSGQLLFCAQSLSVKVIIYVSSITNVGDSSYLVTAMYYSPGQWCSVGHVIHNLGLPNLKHIWGHATPIYLSPTHSDRLGPSP